MTIEEMIDLTRELSDVDLDELFRIAGEQLNARGIGHPLGCKCFSEDDYDDD